jgi:DNA-binding transcriptional LysR family regulator
LQAFLSVADRGSFHRAATHLHLSQTAISHRIKKLEEELGVRLFARTTREVSLTQAGLELVETARDAVAQLEESLDRLRRPRVREKRILTIACLPTFALHRLPPVLARFKKIQPDVDVKIHEVLSMDLPPLLLRGEAAFGLSVVLTNRWDLDVEPLIEADPFVLVCPVNHKLAKRKAVKWSELKHYPLIRVGRDHAIRTLIDDALGTIRDELEWKYEVQGVETAVALAEADCGLTIVPRSNFALYRGKQLTARPMESPNITCSFGIVTKRGVPLPPVTELLLDLLRKQITQQARLMKNRR